MTTNQQEEKRRIIDELMENLRVYLSIPSQSTDELKEYLSGNADVSLKSWEQLEEQNGWAHQGYYSGCYYQLISDYDGNPCKKQVVQELIQALSEYAPYLLASIFSGHERYQYYQDAGVGVPFLAKEWIHTVRQEICQRNFNHTIAQFAESLQKESETARAHYAEIIRVLLPENDAEIRENDGWKMIAVMLLAALHQDFDLLERKLFPALQTVPQVLQACCTDTYTHIAFCVILHLCPASSEEAAAFARKIFARCPLAVYEQQIYILTYYKGAKDCLMDLYRKYRSDVGAAHYMLYCSVVCEPPFRPSGIQALCDFVEQRPERFQEIFLSLLDEKSVFALPAYTVLKKTRRLSPEQETDILPKLSRLIVTALHQAYEDRTRPDWFSSRSGGKANFETFQSLEQENFQDVTLVMNESSYDYWLSRNLWFILGMACVCLAGELPAARNTLLVFAGGLEDINISQMRMMANSDEFPAPNETLPEIFLAHGASFSLICRIFLAELSAFRPDAREKAFASFLLRHKEQAENMLASDEFPASLHLLLLEIMYGRKNDEDGEKFATSALVGAMNKKSKDVVKFAENILISREEEARPLVEELRKGKNKMAADAACRLLRLWDDAKIDQKWGEKKDPGTFFLAIEQEYTAVHEKNTPYAGVIAYDTVRYADGEEKIPEKVMKLYIAEYIILQDMHRIKLCDEIQKLANLYDLRNLVKQIYEMWISEGFAPKYKNILLPYALCAGTAQLDVLKKQIDEWAANSKPSLAAWAVQCMALNGGRMAMLYVNSMGQKHKSKKVRATANEALQAAMEWMKMTPDEFEDMMVPDLGFSADRTRIFSYGPDKRSFQAVLNRDLSLTLLDLNTPERKILKSLPKASAKLGEEEDAVNAVKEEWSAIKKQGKAIFDAQKSRLERALYNERLWPIDKWRALFLGNPLMFGFATGLLWEELEQTKSDETVYVIKGVFRYMEDGSFCDAEEETYTPAENSWIRLFYPMDVSESELEKWKGQLDDYEIRQPVSQVDLPVPALDGDAGKRDALEEYHGLRVYGATVKSAATKLGGSLSYGDYGSCNGLFCQFSHARVTLHVRLDSSFYPGDYNAITAVESVYFMDDTTGQRLLLEQAPPRLLAFALLAGNLLKAKAIGEKEESR